MSVGDYCQQRVTSAEPGDTVREAARRMVRDGTGCVVVVDEGRPVGVVTDRDVVMRVLAEHRDAGSLTVGELVEGRPAVVRSDEPLGAAASAIRRRACRRLPVVDADGRLVGILTADDLLRVVTGELAGLGAAIHAQRAAGTGGPAAAGEAAP